MLLASATLARRELVRFFRQRSRVIGALATPVVFWLLVGSAFEYIAWLVPGTLVMILLFTSIFSTISIIEDRREGFLQGVLVSPVPRTAVVLGKVLGGTAVALIQGTLFLVLATLAGVWPGFSNAAAAVGVMAAAAFALTSLGTLLAWGFESVQGFHSVMNLVLVPLWLLSGAVVPLEKSAGWMQAAMKANPLAYAVSALRRLLSGEGPAAGPAVLVVTAFGAAMFALAAWSARDRA